MDEFYGEDEQAENEHEADDRSADSGDGIKRSRITVRALCSLLVYDCEKLLMKKYVLNAA